ncbi:MAG TPA: type II secretion system F family protein [Actinomycetota bacterium]|nr:type II secretion system F family protein [Actinomycetota bacterium]
MKPPWRRDPEPPATDAAAAVRALAVSIRAGLPPAAAVARWPALSPAPVASAVATVAARVALGQSPADALRCARDVPAAPALARCFALHAAAGGSLPRLLERVADAIERDAAAAGTSRAATSGARLSARLVAGLPLAFVPLTSGGNPFRGGVAGALLFAAGASLAAVGLWWIGRLVPRPAPGDDGAAALADDVAVALDGGIGLVPALEAAASHPPPPLAGEVARARAKASLGASWVDALRAEGEPLRSLAEVIARSREWGVPAGDPLREWAASRREQVRIELQHAVRRAPVLMVVPLTVCVLPAFALLAFGPLVLAAIAGR